MALSPYMNLVIPTPSVTPGPQWASNVSNDLTQIDSHNHTPGYGAPIPETALSITGPLPFNNQPATAVAAITFDLQSAYATLQSLYSSGTGDLYYTDGAGNVVQITSGGAVNATTSGLHGGANQLASFSGSTLNVYADSTTSAPTPANIRMANALLGAGTAGFYVTVHPPTLSGSYDLYLPSIPGSLQFVTLDTSGNLATASNVSAAQIASGSITGSQIAAATVTSGNLATQGTNYDNFTTNTNSTSYVDITTPVSLAVSGTRVVLAILGPSTNGSSSSGIYLTSSDSGAYSTTTAEIALTDNANTVIGTQVVSGVASNGSQFNFYAGGSIIWVLTPPAETVSVKLRAKVNASYSSDSVYFQNMQFRLIEL